jgi:phospholipid/cholesterol/gamma-HCH transport system substrate-binding protein
MRSRTLREGSVGLLILAGVGLFGGLILWLRGINPGERAYTLEVDLPDAGGVEVGSPVRYRGVKVGSVTGIKPSSAGVQMSATITSAKLLIPRAAVVETTQSGFIGQVFLDFLPPQTLPAGLMAEGLTPFEPSCNPQLIVCDGDRLQGQTGIGFDQLIRSTTKIARVLDQSKVIDNASVTLKDLSAAAKGVNQLTKDARGQIRSFSVAANSVTQAANQVTDLIKVNRGTVNATLKDLNQAGQELRVAIHSLGPFVNKIEKGKFLDNLEVLADNGAKASTNLRDFSATLNNPLTVFGLAQTLDSARVTFMNAQKITTDLEQVTGDATFRANLVKLVNALSKLVSSSKDLEKQMRTIQKQQSSLDDPPQTIPDTTPKTTPKTMPKTTPLTGAEPVDLTVKTP